MNPDQATREFLQKAGYTAFEPGQGDIRVFIAGLIQTALTVVGILFFIMILYGGYMWLTAGGNEEQVKKAKQFIMQAVIGFTITITAMIITRFVVGFIADASNPAFGGAPSGETLFNP